MTRAPVWSTFVAPTSLLAGFWRRRDCPKRVNVAVIFPAPRTYLGTERAKKTALSNRPTTFERYTKTKALRRTVR